MARLTSAANDAAAQAPKRKMPTMPETPRRPETPRAPRAPVPELTANDRREIRGRLARPVGRYDAERASQLSGIPERTIRHWGETGVVVPDFGGSQPMHWSYRDLVLLRLAAWLRSKDMEPKWVGERIGAVRKWLEDPKSSLSSLRSQGKSMVVGDEPLDRVSGELLIPEVVGFIADWDLFASLPETRRSHLWGPHLLRPTTRIQIIPWVMAGEPCVESTRVPTSTLWALHQQRGLNASRIAHLYPSVSEESILEAIDLEGKLRRLPVAA
jgi:uncharacterized protein (DUF433 family)